MANGSEGRSRHFILEGFTDTEPYRSLQRGGQRSDVPERDRASHGSALQGQIDELRVHADAARKAQEAAGVDEELGLQVEFESFPEIELAFESLARERSGIELLNVRHVGDRTHATVFVPDGKLDHFERLHPRLPGRKTESRRPGLRSQNAHRCDSRDPRGESSGALDGYRRRVPHGR